MGQREITKNLWGDHIMDIHEMLFFVSFLTGIILLVWQFYRLMGIFIDKDKEKKDEWIIRLKYAFIGFATYMIACGISFTIAMLQYDTKLYLIVFQLQAWGILLVLLMLGLEVILSWPKIVTDNSNIKALGT